MESAVDFFSNSHEQIRRVTNDISRRKIIAHNGCILIEAPTGAGKTIIAGNICNEMAQEIKIVWFWFAPFSGLVGQAEKTIREEFVNLKVKDIKNERNIESSSRGDIFVTTWASVATKKTESRKIRTPKETISSIDNLIMLLKQEGYHIGVVVDEAHHGFKEDTEALNFYKNVLNPEYTILITATPKDRDVNNFKEATGFYEVHKLSVSREDSVKAGLVKKGIRAIAYLSKDSTERFVDFETTAYRHGIKMHNVIKNELENNGVDLEPLLLVQVESGKDSAENAKKKLIELGVEAESIAIHTADEPDPDILALAADESVKVLIFKMSVAMGFDAPRAFALISMRRSKDPDFGIQVVGRILRVHKKLQGKKMPDILNYGYVFLADYSSQSGLTTAAQRINDIKTELIDATTNLNLVTVTDENGNVNIIKNGQVSFWFGDNNFSQEDTNSGKSDRFGTQTQMESNSGDQDNGFNKTAETNNKAIDEATDEFDIPLEDLLNDVFRGTEVKEVYEGQEDSNSFITGVGDTYLPNDNNSSLGNEYQGKVYQIREDINFPHQFKREKFRIGVSESILNCVISHVNFDGEAITNILSRKTKVTKRDIEIFSQNIQDEDTVADVSMKEITKLAQQTLFENEYLNGRQLHDALINKLKEEVEARGWSEDTYDGKIEEGLYIILTKNPKIVRKAIRNCLKNNIDSENASLIDKYLESTTELTPAKLNIYKIFPPNMNRWERKFAELIDNDTTGTILWWHRNEPKKPWGVTIALPESKYDFWPDFIVGIKDRQSENRIILVEIKGNYQSKDSVIKARANHKDYGRALMLHWKDEKEWYTVVNDEDGSKNELDQIFRIGIMKGY